jgi:glutamate/tyrosine decarboxylase-like PLP-dependent enzyme
VSDSTSRHETVPGRGSVAFGGCRSRRVESEGGDCTSLRLLLPEGRERAELWKHLEAVVERHLDTIRDRPVSGSDQTEVLNRLLGDFDFALEQPLDSVMSQVVDLLTRFQVQTTHPSYFGLFNPAPSFASILAETLVSAFSPQLGSRSHSPVGVDVENLLVKRFGERFGYGSEEAGGTFTTGGGEANLTAVILALARAWPQCLDLGLRSLPGQPTVYLSALAHHSLHKAVRCAGLGTQSLREIGVDAAFRIDISALRRQIESDRRAGFLPLLLIGTIGTTMSGSIDPLDALAEVAMENDLWLHVDAAWGGAAVLSSRLKHLCSGTAMADSITFDPHKWLTMPAGCGLFLTKHPGLLPASFRADNSYMPATAAGRTPQDPYARSLQWTRRFSGLKLFMTLGSIGWQGYERLVNEQTDLGHRLRRGLEGTAWRIANSSELPLVCFRDGASELQRGDQYHRDICAKVVNSGRGWISTVDLPGTGTCLRACVTNYRTTAEDVDSLITLLGEARTACEAPL